MAKNFLLVPTGMCVLVLAGCVPQMYEQRQIACIRAVGVVGDGASRNEGDRQIESTLAGLTALFQKHGFHASMQAWARQHGKRYNYGYYLTGERIYDENFTYGPVQHVLVQCLVNIDRKKAKLLFLEEEWPIKSHQFPLSERDRQHVRGAARAAADYLRRQLPSHTVELSFDAKISDG
jgi:hypothetical protein